MNCEVEQLINQIEQNKSYLTPKAKTELYSELIAASDRVLDNLKINHKPVVKIVSPSAILARNLKTKSQANAKLRSLYEFQVISPVSNIRQIVQNCDLICLIYYFKHNITKRHRLLIKFAQQENIGLVLLVKQPQKNIQDTSLSTWLTSQNYTLDAQVHIALDELIDLNKKQHLKRYQQFLIQLSTLASEKFIARSKIRAKTLLTSIVNRKITSFKQEIADIRETYLQNITVERYKQQLRKSINQLQQERQQVIREIKQHLNFAKGDLLNPFSPDSLLFSVQQMIDLAQIKIVKETEASYLYLTVNVASDTEYIHNYVIEFCQQKVNELMAAQWSQINYCYGGGLKSLTIRINEQLSSNNCLLSSENKLPALVILQEHPNLDLQQIINYSCLKSQSRIIFDYHFTQNSLFRLLIFLLIGLGIYLFTLISFGEGKYIGFAIVVFQFINLITGQNIKKAKLKQHSKELKQTISRNYQNLIRLVIDQSIKTLIIALERENKIYDQELIKALDLASARLEKLQQTINQNQSRINSLKQDRSKILTWFD
ncbi:MAG: hypothetical protein AAGE84_11580 [Cyanobacteria bacterium P01_G01_bin.39]